MSFGADYTDWQYLEELGLTEDLLPVVSDPGAKISPLSKMQAVGKTPSRYNRDRQAAGIAKWTELRSTSEDIKNWTREPNYGICIQTRLVRAIDVDITDPDLATEIHLSLPGLPFRWRSNSPKFLMPFIMPGEYTKRRIITKAGAIEFLANGQQFVAFGTHPSGVRYQWDPQHTRIPQLDSGYFEQVWATLQKEFGTVDAVTSLPPRKSKVFQHLIENDETAKALHEQGLILGQGPDGRLDITCPWTDEHTTESAESSTSYWPAHTGGFSGGGFRCLHAHCEHRTVGDLRTFLGVGDVSADFEAVAETPVKQAPEPQGDASDDFEVEGEAAPAKPEKRHKYAPITLAEFVQAPPAKWIVRDVIPDAGLVVIYGEPGSGKSFLALDLAGSIARGHDWRGKRTRQGRVVYIAAEGVGGMRNRAKAYAQEHDVDSSTLPVSFITSAPQLTDGKDTVELCKQIIAAHRKVSVVVIDTLARSFGAGDENSAEDMGKVLKHCAGIHTATGAVVVLVHHSGKDSSRGARGHSSLLGAADAELEVTRSDRKRAVRVTKQKDGEDGAAFGFELRNVVTGEDDEGEPITSCVVVHTEVPAALSHGKLGSVERGVLAALEGVTGLTGEGMETDALVAAYVADTPAPVGGRDRRAEVARRGVRLLLERGILVDKGGLLTVVEVENAQNLAG